jgi:molybdate-binding protein/DNA-binding transcriptional regulator YhcF (GntR family)
MLSKKMPAVYDRHHIWVGKYRFDLRSWRVGNILLPMEEVYLYRQITEHIRREILSGVLKPGDQLPSVKQMAARWDCTVGTAQHAYQELVRQGLVTSRPGQGTRVVDGLPVGASAGEPLRRLALVNRAEAFLLETLTAGYTMEETESAVRQALERWQVAVSQPIPEHSGELRFAGSHDPVVSWLAGHFNEIAAGYSLACEFSGSLGGLLALVEGKADIAGCHLLDEQSGEYNLPFVRRFFPSQKVALVTLAHRRLGLILPPGNPAGVSGLADLRDLRLRLANRQPGSGTRVWLDQALRRLGIAPDDIAGYQEAWMTHSAVARQVAEGQADVGIGLEAAARSYSLDFILLTHERYDLVLTDAGMQLLPARRLIDWLGSPEGRQAIETLGGHDTRDTGRVEWCE